MEVNNFGKYYRCCVCLCDIMRYVRVVPTNINFNDGTSSTMNLLTIVTPVQMNLKYLVK